MKRIVYFVFTFVFCFTPSSFSQTKKDGLDTSDLYKILNKQLPVAWEFQDDGQKITITYKKPVWVLSKNNLNLSVNGDQYQEKDRIKKEGQKVYLHIYLDYEKRWSQEKIQKVKQQNQLIYDELTTLIEDLQLRNMTHKGWDFIAHTELEKKNLKIFEQEKAKRLQWIKKIPDYHVGEVSLYYREDTSMDPTMYIFSFDPPEEQSFYQSIQKIKSALAGSH